MTTLDTAVNGTAATPAEFVRTQPHDMPATEVVKRARESGIKLTTGVVYRQRSLLRQAQTTVAKASRNKRNEVPDESADAFKRLALRVGSERAYTLLNDLFRAFSPKV